MLYCQYEREESGHTKNAAELRDTNTDSEGLIRRPRKGSEANQALNSPPPPEEVASQTERSCHCGDCNAKHIRSGSLEDV